MCLTERSCAGIDRVRALGLVGRPIAGRVTENSAVTMKNHLRMLVTSEKELTGFL